MSNPDEVRTGAAVRTAIVAGASDGFGREITLELARQGWQVQAGFRGRRLGFAATANGLLDDASDLPGVVNCRPLDVTDADSIAGFVDHVSQDSDGYIEALVNVVGFGTHGPWESLSTDQFRANLETNLIGPFALAQAVVPFMRQRGAGRIVNFSSQAGLRTGFWESLYSAAKYGVEGLSLGMRLELQQFGILVSVVCPGFYRGTGYGDSIVVSDDMATQDGAYGPLLTAFQANQAAVEAGHEGRLHEVSNTVLEILDSPAPAFRYPVGCPDVRYIENLDLYERQIFDFYSINEFRFDESMSCG